MGDLGSTDSKYNVRNRVRVRLGTSQLYSGSEWPSDLNDAQIDNDMNFAQDNPKSCEGNNGGLGAVSLSSEDEQVREVHARPCGVKRGRSFTHPAWLTDEQGVNPQAQDSPQPPSMWRPPQPSHPPPPPIFPDPPVPTEPASNPPLPPSSRPAVAVRHTHHGGRGSRHRRDNRRANNRHIGRIVPSASNTAINTATTTSNPIVTATDPNMYYPGNGLPANGMQFYQVVDVVAVGIVRPMPPPPPPTFFSWQQVSLQSHHYNVTAETTAYQTYSAVIQYNPF